MGLFRDSLKKWFYTNNSSAASRDARVPLLNADGTPKGSDTMTNLASVLGGILLGAGNTTAGMNTDNALNITQGTWLFVGGSTPTLNSPDPKKYFYAVALKVHSNGKLLVFAVETHNDSVYYTTIGTADTSVTWKNLQVLS